MKVRATQKCYQGRPPRFRNIGDEFEMPDDALIESFLIPVDKPKPIEPAKDAGSKILKRRGRPPKQE